jgi:hypothetical protein
MGVELFGGEYTVCFAVACFTAYLASGHSGIYGAQRLVVPKKSVAPELHGRPLREVWRRTKAESGES